MRKLYSFVLWLIQPLYLLKLLWRSRTEPLYRHALLQRWGHYAPLDPTMNMPMQPRLWLHAVSLGETRAAAALVKALRQECPGLRLLLTHGTATGWQAGSEILRPGDVQAWLPLDTPAAVRRFLNHFRPCAGVLLETEIWPNLIHQSRQRGIPVLLANARLSERSLRKASRMSGLIQPAVESLSFVLAQSEADLLRFRKAGVKPEFSGVFGNVKFDMNPDAGQLSQGRFLRNQLSRPVILAASTREGEEPLLLQAWRTQMEALREGQTRPLLLLVPRHPQRFDEVARIIQAHGLRFLRKSETLILQGASIGREIDVLLGDSIGELAFY
ncbi:MAG: 3-deoxy-D-manno-octulosonic acid transferase, partial [Burkholderiales bacterium]